MIAILTGYGINADKELARAFTMAGGEVTSIHVQDVMDNPSILEPYAVIAFPGGFSFGDHIGSGTILAHLMKKRVIDVLRSHLAKGGLVLGICNGFQTLVKMGILPDTQGDWSSEVSLVHNSGGAFLDTWVGLEVNSRSESPWLAGIEDFDCPIRHGEGQFIPGEVFGGEFPEELVAFRYSENPNGSYRNIAGILDGKGQVLGMMPHPEAFIRSEQHPRGKRGTAEGDGLRLFKNAVAYAKSLA